MRSLWQTSSSCKCPSQAQKICPRQPFPGSYRGFYPGYQNAPKTHPLRFTYRLFTVSATRSAVNPNFQTAVLQDRKRQSLPCIQLHRQDPHNVPSQSRKVLLLQPLSYSLWKNRLFVFCTLLLEQIHTWHGYNTHIHSIL